MSFTDAIKACFAKYADFNRDYPLALNPNGSH